MSETSNNNDLSKTLRKRFSLRAIIIGLSFIIFLLALRYITYSLNMGYPRVLGGHFPVEMGRGSQYLSIMGYFFIIPLISALLPKKYRLNTAELALIYSMIAPMFFINQTIGNNPVMMAGWIRDGRIGQDIIKYLSPVMGVKDRDLTAAIMTGGGVVPWSEWTTPIIWWILFTLSAFFFQIFGITILRKQWIDVEALPFPLESMTWQIMKSEEDKRPIFGNKWLLFGLVIGLVNGIVYTLGIWYPAVGTSNVSHLDLSNVFGRNGFWLLVFNVWYFGFGLIAPLDFTFTCSLGAIVLLIIAPPILINAGEMRPPPPGWDILRNLKIFFPWQQNAGFYHWGWQPLFYGVLVATAVWPLFRHRKNIIQSLRLATKSSDSDGASFSRIIWLGWGLSALLYIAMEVAAWVRIDWAIINLAIYGIVTVAYARMIAETGMFLGNGIDITQGDMWLLSNDALYYAFGPKDPAVSYPAITLGHQHQEWTGGLFAKNSPGSYSLGGYKLGRLGEQSDRNILVSQLIGVTLASVIAIPLGIYAWYTWSGGTGVLRVQQGPYWAFQLNRGLLGPGAPWAQPNNGLLIMFVIGLVFALAVYVLRNRFGGLFAFISPAGIYVIKSGFYMWFPFLIAAIVKWIILKFLGNKEYQEKIVPLATGLVVGFAILSLPAMFVAIARETGYL